MTIRFTKIEDGIDISLFGSEGPDADAATLVKTIVDKDAQPRVGFEYSVDSAYSLVVIAHPKQGSTKTNFEFEFRVVGEEYPYYEQFFEHIKASSDPAAALWGWSFGFIGVVLAAGIGIGGCIHQSLYEEKSIEDDEAAPRYNQHKSVQKNSQPFWLTKLLRTNWIWAILLLVWCVYAATTYITISNSLLVP